MNSLPIPRRAKKRLGCFIPTLIITALLGAAGYFFVGKPVSQLAKGFSNLEAFTTLDKQVRNTSSYTPPASSELSEEQMTRYMSVIETVQASAMSRIQTLESSFGDVDFDNLGPVEAYRTVLTAYRVILDAAVGVKEEQVQALNAAGFSLEEYSWVRSQVAAAAGFSANELNLENLLSGELGGQTVPVASNAHNKALVEPFLGEFGEWAPLLLFGL